MKYVHKIKVMVTNCAKTQGKVGYFRVWWEMAKYIEFVKDPWEYIGN